MLIAVAVSGLAEEDSRGAGERSSSEGTSGVQWWVVISSKVVVRLEYGK